MNGNAHFLHDPVAPPALRKGDQVAIVATARKVKPEELQACIHTLNAWGLEVSIVQGLFDEDRQFGGDDAHRLHAFQSMLEDSSIRAILFARGGYGSLRIIDQIDFSALKRNPKWLIGFSDVTPILNQAAHMGVQAIHGPMAISFNGKTADEQALSYLKTILMEEDSLTYEYAPGDQSLVRPGMAEGRLLGGNLSLLSHMIGTGTDFFPDDCMLFIEDIDEYLYNIDRLVLHLKRASRLDKLKAMIVGGMTEMKDNEIPFGRTAEQIAFEHTSGFAYPFCSGFPSGHFPTNYPLVIGSKCRLKVSHVKVEFTQRIA